MLKTKSSTKVFFFTLKITIKRYRLHFTHVEMTPGYIFAAVVLSLQKWEYKFQSVVGWASQNQWKCSRYSLDLNVRF